MERSLSLSPSLAVCGFFGILTKPILDVNANCVFSIVLTYNSPPPFFFFLGNVRSIFLQSAKNPVMGVFSRLFRSSRIFSEVKKGFNVKSDVCTVWDGMMFFCESKGG